MKRLLGILLALVVVSVAHSQDSPYRKELKRADLTGTNMEVITSINDIKPGQSSALHIHHGEEAFYVIEGGTIELPDGKQGAMCPSRLMSLPCHASWRGAAFVNRRNEGKPVPADRITACGWLGFPMTIATMSSGAGLTPMFQRTQNEDGGQNPSKINSGYRHSSFT